MNVLCAGIALAMAGSAFAANGDSTRVWVKFTPGSKGNVEHALRAAGGRIHYTFDNLGAFAVSLPTQAIDGLRHNPNVEYVEEDAPRHLMGETTPYGIPMVQATDAVAIGADGTGVKVCVIDSGLKADHEDFSGVALSGDASSGQSWNVDTCGHGTHTSGTIAAAANNTGVVGVSPGKVALHMVKVFDGPDCAWSYSSTLVDAANKCQQAGAKIISMSLGGGRASRTERNAFNQLYSQGILSIAAAGNDGNSTMSYPASYDSVMSVAAIDNTSTVASFSQYNSQVEIAAPGVGVLSTYPTRDGYVAAAGATYMASAMEGSPQSVVSGAMVDGGRCTAAGSWSGKVVLCERGDIAFSDKVLNVQSGGGIAAIVYNNAAGGFSGTLNGVATSIPSVSMAQADGQGLVAGALGQSATVSAVVETNVSGYAYLDGTSMATPHVSGVAALVWSANPTATNVDIRNALDATAIDLGSAGRDNYYGYGLVQALAAIDSLAGGSNPPPTADAPTGLTASLAGSSKGKTQFALAWSGGAGTVDIYRDGSKIRSGQNNSGSYTDSVKVRGSGSFTYQVCNAGTSDCTGSATVSY